MNLIVKDTLYETYVYITILTSEPNISD